MRVSVSEHTGNAKTPKNIVTSDEKETLNKVRTFEGKEGEFDPLAHNLAEDQNLRLDKFVTHSATPANKQSVQTTAAKANPQSVTSDTLKDNLQTITSERYEDNRQGIGSDNLQDNLRGIPSEKFEENKQGLPVSTPVDKNTQSIPSTNVDTNIQSISNPQVASHKPEGIAKERVNSNSASIHVDATANNKQTIESASFSDNLASFQKETHHETRQALDKDSFQDRDATVAKTSVDGNVQAVPTAPSIGDNLQPVENKPIADHFETLPIDARPLGESATPKSNPIANKAATKPLQSVTTKAAVARANPLAKPQKIGASSAISSAEAQKIALAHKAQMEAFHGRLAGIKHNVDELNNKLDDLENKS